VLDVTGTWEIVLTATPEPVLTPAVQQTGMTVEAHVARNTYAAWGGGVAGGMLEWYRAQYGAEAARQAQAQGGSDWDYLMAEAAAARPGAGGVLFLPHLSGAGCPLVDANSRGAFVGLSDRTTRGDLLRAMIEGLDYQFLEVVLAMESSLSQKLDRFIAIGGAIHNTFWMQNKADIVGRPVEVPQVEEATPLGAAILAGIGVGLYRDEQDALEHVFRPGKTYEPDPERHARYAESFATYRQLYPALQAIHHRLATTP
jgi:xylulokinase